MIVQLKLEKGEFKYCILEIFIFRRGILIFHGKKLQNIRQIILLIKIHLFMFLTKEIN